MTDRTGQREEKDLENLRKELEKKEEELEKKEKRLKRIEDDITKRRCPYDVVNQEMLEKIRNFPQDTRLIIEDKSLGRETFIGELYSLEQNSPEFIEYICDKEKLYKGPVRFLEEEVEPADAVETDCELEFRFWKLTGQELKAFQGLTHLSPGVEYKRNGWEGVRDLLSDLKKVRDNPLQIYHLKKKNCGEFCWPQEIRDFYSIIRKRIVNRSFKNDLTVEESIASLYLEDDEFVKKYDGLKSFLREKVEEWEKSFNSYIPSKETCDELQDSNQISKEV